jgi:hypothetical protein
MAQVQIDNIVTAPLFTLPGHAFSAGAIIGVFLGFLPPTLAVVATSLAICFYLVQLWESPTVQTWYKGREYMRLKQRQAATAKILALNQIAAAKALAAFQEADAQALVVRQKLQTPHTGDITVVPPAGRLDPPK